MATRRGVGVGAIQKNRAMAARLKEKGSELSSEELERLRTQLDAFKLKLEEFATKHRSEIRKNPGFRRHFQEMCASAGVDPLASGKGFWAEKLGVGDFYYELGVQVVEVCLASAHANGGVITLEEIKHRLDRSRSKTRKDTISQDDLVRAIQKLSVLNSGFALLPLASGRFLVQSVPGELSMDHTRVFQLAEETANISIQRLVDEAGWSHERANTVINKLIQSQLVWADGTETETETVYWFPSLFMNQQARSKTSSSSRTSSDESAR